MKITDEEILSNWEELIEIINKTFTGERLENILKLMDYFSERMSIIPASNKESFHNCFPGGYVQHILHVIKNAQALKNVWESAGCEINFSDEELVFSALFHDLGKVGDMINDYYMPNENDWRRKTLGEIYSFNPKIDYMQVTDRTFYLLSQFNIKYSIVEFLSIRLADGLYAEHNKPYYITYSSDTVLKSCLPFIIHNADLLSARSEFEAWKRDTNIEKNGNEEDSEKPKYTRKKTLAEKVENTNLRNNLDTMFDELFNDSVSKAKKGEII